MILDISQTEFDEIQSALLHLKLFLDEHSMGLTNQAEWSDVREKFEQVAELSMKLKTHRKVA